MCVCVCIDVWLCESSLFICFLFISFILLTLDIFGFSLFLSIQLSANGEKPTLANAETGLGMRAALANALISKGHPLSVLLDACVRAFQTSYRGVGANRRLLSTAVYEVCILERAGGNMCRD